jgi:hypothetical protein
MIRSCQLRSLNRIVLILLCRAVRLTSFLLTRVVQGPRLSFRKAYDPRPAGWDRGTKAEGGRVVAEPTTEDLASLGEALVVVVRKALSFASDADVGTEVNGEKIFVQGQGEWTAEMVRRLKQALTYPAAMTMLDMVAERPDQEVKFTEVVDRSGLSARQVASELGAMSKLSRKLFGGRKIWPVRWWQDASDNITRYVMQRRIAEWWRSSG